MDEFQKPIVTVDAIVLTFHHGKVHAVLQKRDNEPFVGAYALPGGFVHIDEDANTRETMIRVLRQKANLHDVYFEQLETFSGPNRDPRGWAVSVVYMALVPVEKLSDLGASMSLVPIDALPDLAFDHDRILQAGIARLKGKGAYSTLPAEMLGDEFTLPDLMAVYEAATDQRLDKSSFRRKLVDLRMLEELDTMRKPATGGRPAKLYRLTDGARTFSRSLT